MFEGGEPKRFSTVLVSVVVPIVGKCRTTGVVHSLSERSTGIVPVVTVATGTFARSGVETGRTKVSRRVTGPISKGLLMGIVGRLMGHSRERGLW